MTQVKPTDATLIKIAKLFESLDYFDLPPRDREIVELLCQDSYLQRMSNIRACPIFAGSRLEHFE